MPDPSLPGDPPPKTVIVRERAYAEGYAEASDSSGGPGSFSAAADDGLGDPAVEASSEPSSWTDRRSRGERYTTHDGSSGTVMVSASPSASADAGSPDPAGWGRAVTSLGYAAAAYPVTIQLTGATSDGSGGYAILIGQHCSPTLQGIPGGCTVSNYQWSVSGPTFQTWSSDTPAIGNNPYNPDASYYVGGPGDLTSATPGWYWHEIGSGTEKPETISCTATVTPPAGEGAAFTVTASLPITVWVPIWSCTGTGGTMQVNTSVPGGSSDYWLWAGPVAGSGETGGMDWRATSIPPFSPVTFGAGSLVMVQLVIPEVSYNVGPGNSIVGTHYVYNENGQEGLDTVYPYPWARGPMNYFAGDTPGLDLSATGATSATVGDQFEDYLIYFAPSSTQCVPLAHFVWSTNGNASIPSSGNWAAFGPGSAGDVTPTGTAINFLPNNSFPMWTQNSGNGTGTFIAE